MADILSLSKARKARARVAKEQTATENRARCVSPLFGCWLSGGGEWGFF